MRTSLIASGLACRFKAANGPFVTAQTLRRGRLTFTELKTDRCEPYETGPRVVEDAIVIVMQLRAYRGFQFWEQGRKAPTCDFQPGDLTINDMRFEGRAIIDQPLHALYCHIPFNAIIDVVGAEFWGRTSALSYSPGQGFEDATIRNLLLSVSQAIHSCSRDRHLYLDHVAVALVAHLVAVRGDALSRRFAA